MPGSRLIGRRRLWAWSAWWMRRSWVIRSPCSAESMRGHYSGIFLIAESLQRWNHAGPPVDFFDLRWVQNRQGCFAEHIDIKFAVFCRPQNVQVFLRHCGIAAGRIFRLYRHQFCSFFPVAERSSFLGHCGGAAGRKRWDLFRLYRHQIWNVLPAAERSSFLGYCGIAAGPNELPTLKVAKASITATLHAGALLCMLLRQVYLVCFCFALRS